MRPDINQWNIHKYVANIFLSTVKLKPMSLDVSNQSIDKQPQVDYEVKFCNILEIIIDRYLSLKMILFKPICLFL